MALSASTYYYIVGMLNNDPDESRVTTPRQSSEPMIKHCKKTKTRIHQQDFIEDEKLAKREAEEEQRRRNVYNSHVQLIESAKQLESFPLQHAIMACEKMWKPTYIYRHSINQGLPKNSEKKNVIHSILENRQLSDIHKSRLILLLFNNGYNAFNTELLFDATILNKVSNPAYNILFNKMYSLLIDTTNKNKLWTPYQGQKILERFMLSNELLANRISMALNQENRIKLLTFLIQGNSVTASYGEQFAINWIHSQNSPQEVADSIKIIEKILADRPKNVNSLFDFTNLAVCFQMDSVINAATVRTFELQLIELIANVNKSPAKLSHKETKEIIIDVINMINLLNHPIDVINVYNKIQKIFDAAPDDNIKQALKLINKAAKLRILAMDIEVAQKTRVEPELSDKDELRIMCFLNTHHEFVFFSFWPTNDRTIYDKIHEEHRLYEAQRKYDEEDHKFNTSLRQFH